MVGELLVATLLGAMAPGPATAQDPLPRFAFTRPAMGTTFRIVLYAPDSASARNAADEAFAVVERLNSLFSDYRADSELARVAEAAGTPVAVSDELLAVLGVAREWSARTEGAFDVTVGPLTRLWRWSARRGELPDPARLAGARAAVGWRDLDIDAQGGAVRLARRGMALDLGGIGKGWAADEAMRVLDGRGIESALVDAGGDVLAGAPPPGERGWQIALPGGGRVTLAHAAVATSGASERWLEVDGVRYSHIVDPRTGLGVPDAPVVTVVARDAATADVLASALSVLDREAGAALIDAEPAAEARVQGPDGWTSADFPNPETDIP